ncbi:MAG: hypothetical protein A3J46_05205 [Candidatus Yanofskybacteria bacterium RIFCSPHIGHO2_02_FULL_41_11]|uniref:Homing endonuclease LAGLIDADG domain-containing protein n=1 Tax=Candidatus Yanofskybacteria bacterium RIFCSPHIGHO2_02_FULL_41_11 TaxID=1802675 RepID=A0A1F8F7K2_9BACT|nr:MAG: hypothetical protein A3J46_05205 [Candidatus Yanofskybacteria bacterium RIFCSPHIGHO2_02_FULL_41_11]
MVIPREAGRITYSTEIRNLKKRLFLNDRQKSIVIGSILGDGNLSPNWSSTNYRLSIGQSEKQKDYLMWKYELLKDWILSKPRYYERTRSLSFRTISHQLLTDLYRKFYKDSKKIVPKDIKDLLTPESIAVWYMDDGNIRRNNGRVYGYYLNTQSFSREENEYLSQVFQDKYDIKSLVIRNKNNHRLYIGVDRSKFREVVKDFIIPSMQYKLG